MAGAQDDRDRFPALASCEGIAAWGCVREASRCRRGPHSAMQATHRSSLVAPLRPGRTVRIMLHRIAWRATGRSPGSERRRRRQAAGGSHRGVAPTSTPVEKGGVRMRTTRFAALLACAALVATGCGNPVVGHGCPDPLTLCGGTCVNLDADHENCGACDHGCADDEVCEGGSCRGLVCGGGLIPCAGVCIDPLIDTANCGRCGHACPPGESCTGGECPGSECAPGEIDCDGRYRPADRSDHCGGCGRACAAGEVCLRGSCTGRACPTPTATGCVDDHRSRHCGACDAAARGTVCGGHVPRRLPARRDGLRGRVRRPDDRSGQLRRLLRGLQPRRPLRRWHLHPPLPRRHDRLRRHLRRPGQRPRPLRPVRQPMRRRPRLRGGRLHRLLPPGALRVRRRVRRPRGRPGALRQVRPRLPGRRVLLRRHVPPRLPRRFHALLRLLCRPDHRPRQLRLVWSRVHHRDLRPLGLHRGRVGPRRPRGPRLLAFSPPADDGRRQRGLLVGPRQSGAGFRFGRMGPDRLGHRREQRRPGRVPGGARARPAVGTHGLHRPRRADRRPAGHRRFAGLPAVVCHGCRAGRGRRHARRSPGRLPAPRQGRRGRRFAQRQRRHPQLLDAAGLLSVASATDVTGTRVDVLAPGDAVASGVSLTYVAERNSVRFDSAEISQVVGDATGPVVIHRVFTP